MSIKLFDLTGKTALVTGGTHGLGMAIAKGLGNAGATIVINDIVEEKLQNAVIAYKEMGIEAHAYHFDVTIEEQVIDSIKKIEKEVAPVDILVNNAGIIKRISILDMKVDEFKTVIDIDLVAPFIMAKTIAPGMIKRGHGKIIIMCSMMSELGRDTVSAYAAAKGGLKMLTKSMAAEWAKFNIQALELKFQPDHPAGEAVGAIPDLQLGSRNPFILQGRNVQYNHGHQAFLHRNAFVEIAGPLGKDFEPAGDG